MVTSKIFGEGKTQVPAEVRAHLNVKDGDTILWVKSGAGYMVRSAEVKLLIQETLTRGGITCTKCGTNYSAALEKCPKCGAPAPKV